MFKSFCRLTYYAKPVNSFPSFRKDFLKTLFTTPKRTFCADPIIILKAVVTKALTKCSTFYDLSYCFDKYERALDLTHLSIILNKFNYLQKSVPKNPRLEAQFNEILNLIIQKYELGEGQGDTKLLTLFYQFVNQSPYNGPMVKRCNFILEQKGIAQYQKMKQSELAGFVTTLAENNKKYYVQSLIPYLSETIHMQPKEKIAKIIHEFTRFNLHAPQLATNLEQFCIKSALIERLEAQEYAYFLHFFSNYPEIKNPILFRKFRDRLNFIKDTLDANTFGLIVEAASHLDISLTGPDFYKILTEKFWTYLSVLESNIVLGFFIPICQHNIENALIHQRVFAHALNKGDKFGMGALIKVFYWINESKKLDISIHKQFTDCLMNYGIDRLKIVEFEMILVSYDKYHNATHIKPSNSVLDECFLFLKERLDGFPFDKFEKIIGHLTIFPLEDQKELCIGVQDRVIKENDKINIDLDFNFIYKLLEISFERFRDSTSQTFVHTVIQIATNMAKSELDKPSDQRNINNLEKLAKLLHLLSDKPVTAEYKEKRGKVFRILEQLFLQFYQSSNEIGKDLTEGKLFTYIMAFYSLIDKPNPEIGKLLQQALRVFDMTRISPANSKFLFEKTDLVEKH